jgi:ABC-type nickel/cobalt efflux system permease component RcnA
MFLAGLLHGLGPDHLAAIAALAGRERRAEVESGELPVGRTNRNRTAWLGVRFALGHVSALLLLAGGAWWLGRDLPPIWQTRLEQLGGLALVFVGGWLLAEVFRRRVTMHEHTHTHEHGHGTGNAMETHSHPHIHLGTARKVHRHPHPAWFLGGVMGLSGARALLTALPLVLAGSVAVVLTRALAFGAGIVISMALAGWLVVRLAGFTRSPAYARWLVAFTGGVSVVLGFYWLALPPGS